MASKRQGIRARLRRGLGRARPPQSATPGAAVRQPQPTATAAATTDAPAARLRGLGEPPAGPDQAPEAELDTLRGELVRELDRLADGDDSSACFRRIAS